jgi:hypothetical protein
VVAEIGSGVTAGLRGGIRACRRNSVRELAVKKKLAAGKFIAQLRKLLDPKLPAHTQLVFPDDQEKLSMTW